MAEGLIVYLPDYQQYALTDELDLPTLPFASGRVAKYLYKLQALKS